MHAEMRASFQYIDARLNAISAVIDQRFDRLDIEVGVIRGDVQQTLYDVIDVQAQLTVLEVELSSGFKTQDEHLTGFAW